MAILNRPGKLGLTLAVVCSAQASAISVAERSNLPP